MDTTIPTETISTESSVANEGVLAGFFRKLNLLLFRPAQFFRQELAQVSLSSLLAFGILNAWLASMIAFYFSTFHSLLMGQLMEKWMTSILAEDSGFGLFFPEPKNFLWQAGFLLLAPFLLLIQAYMGAFYLYIFGRALITAPDGGKVQYQEVLRVQAAALVSHWFRVVPLFGPVLAFVAHFVYCMAGLRETYRISSRRAFAVVAAPYLMLMILGFVLAVIAAFALSQMPWAELLEFDRQSMVPFPDFP
jgi:hypothetical protein